MKQLIILVSLFLFVSCSVRKVQKSEVKKDSLSQIDTKIVTKEDIKTEIKNDICIDEFTITPLDSSKQITINGKTYKNVVLKYKKTKDNTSLTKTKKLSKNEVKSETVKTSFKEFKKETIALNWWWLLLLLLIPIGYYIYKKI